MRQKDDGKGYYRVNLYKDGKGKSELVSRVVAIAFIPNPNGFRVVGHQEASRITGASSGKISMCCNGIRKKHQGKTWRFA